jgi:hypothetical protein
MATEKSYVLVSNEIADIIDVESVSSLSHFHTVNFLDRKANLLKARRDENEDRFLLVKCETSDLVEKLIMGQIFIVDYNNLKFKSTINEIQSDLVELKITEVIQNAR